MSDIHTLPVGDLVDHKKSRWCWCQPAVRIVCDSCDGEGKGEWGECGVCEGGGMCDVARSDLRFVSNCHVIHNAVDGRP